MTFYQNSVIDLNNRPIVGLQITVLDGLDDTVLVPLTDATGEPLDNPVTSDANGVFSFYVAEDMYVDLEYRQSGRLVRVDNDVPVGNPPPLGISRAVLVPEGETAVVLPPLAQRIATSSVLGFDTLTGDPVLRDSADFKGDPGGNAQAIGVRNAVSTINLNSGPAAGFNVFKIDGAQSPGDAGLADYARLPADTVREGTLTSADGQLIGLTDTQTLTPYPFGAPMINRSALSSTYLNAPDLANLPDNRAAVQAMLTEASRSTRQGSREVVVRGTGMIPITDSIILPRLGVDVIMDGDARFIRTTPIGVSGGLFSYRPADPTTYYTLAADAPRYTDRIKVPDASIFPVNGWVHIRSQTLLPALDNSQNDKCGQIAKVLRRDSGNVLILDRVLYYDYLVSATADVAMIPDMGMARRMMNIQWGINGSLNAGAPYLHSRMFDTTWIEGWQFDTISSEGQRNIDGGPGEASFRGCFAMANCVNIMIRGARVTNSGWYAVSVGNGCQDVTVRDSIFDRCRHGVSLVYSGAGNGYGEPVNTTVDNCRGYNCDYAAFDTHGTGFGTTFSRLYAAGGTMDCGIQIRNREARVLNCEAHYNNLDGLNVEVGGADCLVRDIIARNNKRRGFASINPSTQLAGQVIIEDNGAGVSGQCGIYMAGGSIAAAPGSRVVRNGSNAISFRVNMSNDLTAKLTISGLYAEQGTAQTRFIVATGDCDVARQISVSDCELRDFIAPVLQSGATAATPGPRLRNVTWSTSANPSPPRSGIVTLSGGVSGTISTAAIKDYAGTTNFSPVRSEVTFSLPPNATEERWYVSSLTDGSGFTIKSSNPSSTTTGRWEIK